MALTGTAIVTHVNSYYDRKMLERAQPKLLHDQYGQKRNIPQRNSDTIKFRRYSKLAQNTTALTEGTTPAGKQLSVTDLTAQVDWYGDFVTLTDELIVETFDPLTSETTAVLGEQMGESLDSIVRDDLHGGSNVLYAGTANTATDEVAAGDVITTGNLDTMILSLKNQDAKKITSFVRPDKGYATTPVRDCFVAICGVQSAELIQALTGFEHVETYANMGNPLPGEFGRYRDIRFVETTNDKLFAGGGTGAIDVYSMIVFGADAYGVTALEGVAMSVIYKPLGSAGSADPLNQRATYGWKAAKVAEILNSNWLIRYEHAIV